MRVARGLGSWLTAFALLATGCATPESRIRKNPDLFASFPPQIQEQVRQGKVDLGYTPDMVLIALGPPRNIYSRKSESGVTEIWAYTDYRYESDFYPVHTTYWYRDRKGRLRLESDWAWIDAGRSVQEESLRIEFLDRRVIAIEALKR